MRVPVPASLRRLGAPLVPSCLLVLLLAACGSGGGSAAASGPSLDGSWAVVGYEIDEAGFSRAFEGTAEVSAGDLVLDYIFREDNGDFTATPSPATMSVTVQPDGAVELVQESQGVQMTGQVDATGDIVLLSPAPGTGMAPMVLMLVRKGQPEQFSGLARQLHYAQMTGPDLCRVGTLDIEPTVGGPPSHFVVVEETGRNLRGTWSTSTGTELYGYQADGDGPIDLLEAGDGVMRGLETTDRAVLAAVGDFASGGTEVRFGVGVRTSGGRSDADFAGAYHVVALLRTEGVSPAYSAVFHGTFVSDGARGMTQTGVLEISATGAGGSFDTTGTYTISNAGLLEFTALGLGGTWRGGLDERGRFAFGGGGVSGPHVGLFLMIRK